MNLKMNLNTFKEVTRNIVTGALALNLFCGILISLPLFSNKSGSIDKTLDLAKKDVFNITATPLEKGECLYINPDKETSISFEKRSNDFIRIILLSLPDLFKDMGITEEVPLGKVSCIEKGTARVIDDNYEISPEDSKKLLSRQFDLISAGTTAEKLRAEDAKGLHTITTIQHEPS